MRTGQREVRGCQTHGHVPFYTDQPTDSTEGPQRLTEVVFLVAWSVCNRITRKLTKQAEKKQNGPFKCWRRWRTGRIPGQVASRRTHTQHSLMCLDCRWKGPAEELNWTQNLAKAQTHITGPTTGTKENECFPPRCILCDCSIWKKHKSKINFQFDSVTLYFSPKWCFVVGNYQLSNADRKGNA